MQICVFCGSSPGKNSRYLEAAQRLGTVLAQEKLGLVYGGGRVGLMGLLADAVLEAGGEVTGVIPTALWEKEVGHRGLTQLHIVGTMHQRKALMAELADAFVALPGGIGTFEELFEIWTWGQLGIHHKPIALLNIEGYYDKLIGFIHHAKEEGFVRTQHASMVIIERDPRNLLVQLKTYKPVHVDKWLEADQT